MDYKEYIKELGESAKKLELAGLPNVAAEYRRAVKVIQELVDRNKAQAEIIKIKLDEIAKLKAVSHGTE